MAREMEEKIKYKTSDNDTSKGYKLSRSVGRQEEKKCENGDVDAYAFKISSNVGGIVRIGLRAKEQCVLGCRQVPEEEAKEAEKDERERFKGPTSNLPRAVIRIYRRICSDDRLFPEVTTRVGAGTGNGDASPEEGEVRFIGRQPSDLDLPPSGKAWCTFRRWPRILKFQDKILKGYTHSNGTHGASEIPQEVLETRKRKKRVTGYTATCTAEPDIALTIVQSRGRHHPWLP
ncbi:hypothetical protein HZH68_009225 [Vespula germanica]|uniref:Uncharacterized protein n=1 Tax=Vespula germanica TaxID=30212 RepID=A0A834N3A1_VESGE|nr:hypothetical protein HZH68_009225 [Vespula germanica]